MLRVICFAAPSLVQGHSIYIIRAEIEEVDANDGGTASSGCNASLAHCQETAGPRATAATHPSSSGSSSGSSAASSCDSLSRDSGLAQPAAAAAAGPAAAAAA